MESNISDFAKYLFSSNTDEKIALEIETDTDTDKNDTFEFMINLIILGVNKFGLNVPKLQYYFNKINVKINYFEKETQIPTPYIITSNQKIMKLFNAEELVASYFYNNKWIYFSLDFVHI